MASKPVESSSSPFERVRGTKVLVFEGAGFDIVQDIANNVGFPITVLKVFQGGLDVNYIVGVGAALDIGKTLRM